MFDVAEHGSIKLGHRSLKLLEAMSNVVGDEGIVAVGGGTGKGIVLKCGGAGVWRIR